MSNTREIYYPREATCDTGRAKYRVRQVAPHLPWRIVELSHEYENLTRLTVWGSDNGDELIASKDWVETFDHLPRQLPATDPSDVTALSLPEEELGACPMSECLAPQRLKVLEEFYKEICRVQNEVNGTANIGIGLGRAINKVKQFERGVNASG